MMAINTLERATGAGQALAGFVGAGSSGVRAQARIPIGWNHPIDKNTRHFNKMEHVLIGKVDPLFRDML
jgi:hypothetical protein